jgi:DNA-binding CsgD family transcriptional regulator
MDAHKDYIALLLKNVPNITQQELKIAVLLRLSMSTKEIADLLKLSSRSIENLRMHIRKKLKISNKEKIYQALMKLSE